MNRPPLATYLIGNPLVAATTVIVFGITLYRWWHGQLSGGVAFILFILTCSAMQANQRLNDYRDWKRAWDQLDGQHRRSGMLQKPAVKAIVAIGLMLLVGGYLFAHQQDPARRIAFGWFVIVSLAGIAYGLFRLIRRAIRAVRRRRAKQKPQAVAICIAKPVLPLPTLARAYQSLPDHCAPLLKRSNSALQ